MSEQQRQIIINEILEAESEIGSLRSEEKMLKKQEDYITSLPMVSGDDLAKNLQKILPEKLVPKNIGKLDHISWEYWYELEFDFSEGADTVFTPSKRISDFFQIGQEAGFLLTHIFRNFKDVGISGQGAPLQFNIKNVQSTRQFNDDPIMLQQIGSRSYAYELPVPILLQPSEKLEIEMSSWFGADITAADTSGIQNLTFMGKRVRMKDTLSLKADFAGHIK